MKRKVTASPSLKSSNSSEKDRAVLQEMFDTIQPYALHPIQRSGLDEGFGKVLEHLGRPDLLAIWFELYG